MTRELSHSTTLAITSCSVKGVCLSPNKVNKYKHKIHYRFGEAPTHKQVQDFNRLATHFFQQHPVEVIGVHCTHGYNRTGFLIIAYLVEVEDWSLEAAVAAFAKVIIPQTMLGF